MVEGGAPVPNEDPAIRAAAVTAAGDHRIASVEAFQVAWRPGDPPGRRSAIVRLRTDSGLVGHGEASPMMGAM